VKVKDAIKGEGVPEGGYEEEKEGSGGNIRINGQRIRLESREVS